MNSFFSVIVERQTAETIERRAVLRPTILRSFFYKRGSVFSSGVKTIATFEPYHWIVPYCIVHITYSVSASFFFFDCRVHSTIVQRRMERKLFIDRYCTCTYICVCIYMYMYTYMYAYNRYS